MLHLPPLNALKAFEASARHLSFKRAAEELRVTQGAVSRHILNLEDFLGTRLFERRHRQVGLTRDGAAYLRAVRGALVSISEATNALIADHDQKTLKLKIPPTCAIRWLVPRLGKFHARHPEISVQVTTSHAPPDFEKDDIDAAVNYGTEIDTGLLGEHLFEEVLVPVLSPELARAAGALRRPHDLTGHLLLHTIQRPDDWPQWFRVAEAPGVERDQGLIFENSSLTYQGAIDGLGVAMAQLVFVVDELKSGRLVSPFDVRVRNASSYFFVYPKERARWSKIRSCHAWIAHEAALTRAIAANYGLAS